MRVGTDKGTGGTDRWERKNGREGGREGWERENGGERDRRMGGMRKRGREGWMGGADGKEREGYIDRWQRKGRWEVWMGKRVGRQTGGREGQTIVKGEEGRTGIPFCLRTQHDPEDPHPRQWRQEQRWDDQRSVPHAPRVSSETVQSGPGVCQECVQSLVSGYQHQAPGGQTEVRGGGGGGREGGGGGGGGWEGGGGGRGRGERWRERRG